MTLRRTGLVQMLLGSALLGACSSSPPAATQTPGQSGTPGVIAGSPASGSAGSTVSSGTGGPAVIGSAAGTLASGTAGTTAAVGGAGRGAAGTGSSAGAGGSGSTAGSGAAGSAAAGSGGGTAGTGVAMAGTGGSTVTPGGCSSLPAVTDYAMPGPFADAKMFSGVGPSSNYTMYRADSSLGKDGFKHPVATWGNGIATTPDMYKKLLTLVASHGFVIIACNDTQPERPCLNAGMDWLVQQNDADGPLKGKLDIMREVALGYSWGGGAAIDVSDRPNIKATISLHGMPPRVTDAFDKLHSPLLLTTSTGDMFVTASGYVTPNYEKSNKVATFYGTLVDPNAGHLYIADDGAALCSAAALLGSTFGSCQGAPAEKGPATAWLRYWACGDEGAKKFFFGDDCVLCKTPWTKPQRKMWPQ
jgi:hypothetical protein